MAYNGPMSNQAYMGVWLPDFPEERMLKDFAAFLGTVPFSPAQPGFTSLVIRAVDPSEAPVIEQDLRPAPADASAVIAIAENHLHADCSYEVQANWDLWIYDRSTDKWKTESQPLEILCHGEDYDEAFWRENGHIQVNLGFEHLFTGHAGLLGMNPAEAAPAESPEEARFLEAMAWPENLRTYHEKTRDNIRKALDWTRRIEKALPSARIRLWSEGEANFEARVESILAAR